MSKRQNDQCVKRSAVYQDQDIDIAQFLFDHDENHTINKGMQDFPKIQNSLPKIIRSPLLQEQKLLQKSKTYVRYSSCMKAGSSSSIEIVEQNNEEVYPSSSERNFKGKMYAKNYRGKKKERLNLLEEENRFLKSKIDDLSFRLKETELQLNKLKHNHQNNTQNFQTTREALLKQIQKVVQRQEESNIQRLLQVEKKLRKLNAFDSKHKMDLLNYFMSELLQNLINDMGFYFIDSLIEKKGLWKEDDSISLRKIDNEIVEIMGMEHFLKTKQMVNELPGFALDHMKNFKNLWKNLYQDYLNIINEGTLIETVCQSLSEHNSKENCREQVMGYLRMELYFQKIKYRKDLRQLRESWFRQFQNEDKQVRQSRNRRMEKKIKFVEY